MAGKVPGADVLDTAELCINLKDHKLFSKDADGNVFEAISRCQSPDLTDYLQNATSVS